MDPTPAGVWLEEAAVVCHDIQLLSKNHRHPEAGPFCPFSDGDWTSIHGLWIMGMLKFGDEGKSTPSAVQTKACPHFAFIQIKKTEALHALVLAETKAFSQKTQVH